MFISEITKVLKKSAVVNIADLISLYRTPPKERYEKNWTAFCKRFENDRKAIYCSMEEKENLVNYFSRDVKYSSIQEYIEEKNNFPKIVFNEWNWNSFEEKFENENLYIEVTKGDHRFEEGFKYEIIEKYADFDYQIYRYIKENENEVIQNIKFFENLRDFNLKLPNNREEQLNLSSNLNEPLFLVQGPPGTGKTTFLAELVFKLISEGKAKPNEIVCLAQTNRAAEEIRIKLRKILEERKIENIRVNDEREQISNYNNIIYVSIIHKNPNLKKESKRKIVLIDEASQISIPLLIYALRYADTQNGFVLRIFGDQKQLSPITPFVRNYQRLTDYRINVNDYIRASDKIFNDFLKINNKTVYEILNNVVDLQNFEKELMKNPLSNSIFGILNDASSNNIEWLNVDKLRKRLMVLNKNFRQIEVLHNLTHNLFYSDIEEHKTEVPNTTDSLFTLNREKVFDDFFDTLSKNEIIKKIEYDFKKIKEKLLENLTKNVLSKEIIIIEHNFEQEGKKVINWFEIITSCLFLYIWDKELSKKEPNKTEKGFGVVTPYRNQETYIKNIFKSSFPESEIIKGKKGEWCATPERFQGRDISRAVYSCVDSQIDSYREVNTMFSENKFNVATSRSSHQQVLLVHSELLKTKELEKEKNYFIENYSLKYLKSIQNYISEAANTNNLAKTAFLRIDFQH
jgi:DNA polymerase III delta prime subunit